MTSPSSNQDGVLRYNLYTSADLQQVWGAEDSGGTIPGIGVGSDSPQTILVFGRIPPGQTPPLGSYMDAVTVTLTF